LVGTICIIAIVVLTLALPTVPESRRPALHGTATLTHVETDASKWQEVGSLFDKRVAL